MSILSVNNLSAGYGKKEIINDISFTVNKGELVGIIGKNGSGKTTLLKALCSLIPYKGDCVLLDKSVKKYSFKELAAACSYIPQRSGITIDISALDVVMMGFNPYLKLLQYPDKNMKKSAITALEEIGLSDKAYENYQTLSEGQKQLCILARTTVQNSKLLLLDEPESALDFSGRYKMLSMIKSLIKSRNTCAIVSLHDPQLALNTCSRLLVLNEKNIVNTIYPERDSISEIENKIKKVYGDLSVKEFYDKSKSRQLALIKEYE